MLEYLLIIIVLPHDTYGRDWGLLIDQKLPAVLGSNIAGVIEHVGAGVNFQLGERVFGMSNLDSSSSDQAGLQEYAILEANAVGKIPEGFSDEQVVTLPINLVTSWIALFTDSGLDIPSPFALNTGSNYDSVSIAILGGGTNVGQFAVQLARNAGIGKIIVIAGPSNQDRLMAMGATSVIDRHESREAIARQIQNLTGSNGGTLLYNCATLDVDLANLILSPDRPSKLRSLMPIEEADAEKLKSQRPLCDASFLADVTNEKLQPYAEKFWQELTRWLTDGKILPTDYQTIEGLEKVKEINEALDGYGDFVRAGPQTIVRISK